MRRGFQPSSVLLTVLILMGQTHIARSETEVRGIIRTTNKAVIASELVARVERVPFREGEAFRRDDLLISFDCRRYTAEQSAASAEVTVARLTLSANLRLQKHNAIGSSEVEISRAKLDEAMGRMEALQVRTSQCKIKAPFDGRVVRQHIHEHEMPKANEPLIEIVGSGQLEIDLLVPSNWLLWLAPDEKFKFTIDETRKTYAVQVERIGAVVDPISQTARLSAIFLEKRKNVLPGMSGTAQFKGFQKVSQGVSDVHAAP